MFIQSEFCRYNRVIPGKISKYVVLQFLFLFPMSIHSPMLGCVFAKGLGMSTYVLHAVVNMCGGVSKFVECVIFR